MQGVRGGKHLPAPAHQEHNKECRKEADESMPGGQLKEERREEERGKRREERGQRTEDRGEDRGEKGMWGWGREGGRTRE
jgi:hypothetical protein